MKRLINITGLPGSGKSTLAALLAQELDGVMIAADDYFIGPDAQYHFDASRLGEAHIDCQRRVCESLTREPEVDVVIVHNTGRTQWERSVYRATAEQVGAQYTEIYVSTHLTDEELAARNVHGVPASTIGKMRKTWQF